MQINQSKSAATGASVSAQTAASSSSLSSQSSASPSSMGGVSMGGASSAGKSQKGSVKKPTPYVPLGGRREVKIYTVTESELNELSYIGGALSAVGAIIGGSFTFFLEMSQALDLDKPTASVLFWNNIRYISGSIFIFSIVIFILLFLFQKNKKDKIKNETIH